MALNKNDSLTGKMGPVVVYTLNGKQVVRARPRPHKKSKSSQQAAKQFGLASKISAQLRTQLYKTVHDIPQKNTRYRFDGVIREWLQNGKPASNSRISAFSSMQQFQFNEKSSLSERLRVQPSVDWVNAGKIMINLPAMVPMRDMAAPPNTASIQCIIEAARTLLKNQLIIKELPSAAINIKYSNKTINSQHIQIPFELKAGELIIAVMALRYITNNSRVLNDEKWMPAGVIGTFYTEK